MRSLLLVVASLATSALASPLSSGLPQAPVHTIPNLTAREAGYVPKSPGMEAPKVEVPKMSCATDRSGYTESFFRYGVLVTGLSVRFHNMPIWVGSADKKEQEGYLKDEIRKTCPKPRKIEEIRINFQLDEKTGRYTMDLYSDALPRESCIFDAIAAVGGPKLEKCEDTW